MNVTGRWYVVSGASNGIGFETALQLSKQENVKVLAVSRSVEKLARLKREGGINIHTLPFDLEKDDPKIIYDYLDANEVTALHGVIHNAGHLVNKPFETITKEELESSYRINVFAPFLVTQKLLPLLKNANDAHVVTISSMGGVQGSAKFPGLTAYSSSKGALSILSECLAQEFSSTNIKVNCLALGSVQTEMLAKAFPGYKAALQPDEMAEYIVWFLLNGHRFFNGKIIPVALSTP